MKKLLMLSSVVLLVSCSTLKKTSVKKCGNEHYKDKTVPEVIDHAKKVINNGERKAVVFGLYGTIPKYITGTIRNVKLVKALYKSWDPVVFVDSVSVTPAVIKELKDNGAVVYSSPDNRRAAARFFVIDLPDYDRFISRDVDSRINWREVAAVADWMESSFVLHNMKDWPSHKNPLMGGMWGGKIQGIRAKLGGKTVKELYLEYTKDKKEKYGVDEDFLKDVILEKVGRENLLSHESFKCNDLPHSVGFPIPLGPGLDAIGGQFE